MIFEFKFPDVGEGITEGVLVKWLVNEGDEVATDAPIAEVETDKAVVELPSPRGGKILSLKVKAGDQITVGQVIVEIDANEDENSDTKNEDSVGVVGDLSGDVMVLDESPEGFINEPVQTPMETIQPKVSEPTPTASSGGGMKKIRKYDMWGTVNHIPYQGIRKSIGDHMAKSFYTAPHVTHTDIMDATNLVAFRTAEKEKGNKLSYMAFIMKAVGRALKEFPNLNASIDEDKTYLIQKNYWSMAFAVDTEHGLMAPVVKRVNQKTPMEISKEITELAQKATERSLDPMDMKGSTFTISNVGSIGGLFFTPIINHPEVAILGVGKMIEMPLVKDGEIKASQVIPFSLSFDHRAADGADAARFLNRVMELLQSPADLMNAEDAIA